MRIIIVGKRDTGKTYLVKELIKSMEIKKIIWNSYKEEETPKIGEYENVTNIYYLNSHNEANEEIDYKKINVDDDTVYVCDNTMYSGKSIYNLMELAKRTKNIIITMSYAMGGVEDYLKIIDKVYCFRENYNENIKRLYKWFEKEIKEKDYEEFHLLERYKYKEFMNIGCPKKAIFY